MQGAQAVDDFQRQEEIGGHLDGLVEAKARLGQALGEYELLRAQADNADGLVYQAREVTHDTNARLNSIDDDTTVAVVSLEQSGFVRGLLQRVAVGVASGVIVALLEVVIVDLLMTPMQRKRAAQQTLAQAPNHGGTSDPQDRLSPEFDSRVV